MAELPISLDSVVKAPKVRSLGYRTHSLTDMVVGNQTMGIAKSIMYRETVLTEYV